jgi:hypothetical protein
MFLLSTHGITGVEPHNPAVFVSLDCGVPSQDCLSVLLHHRLRFVP